jgi:hypothetical protein
MKYLKNDKKNVANVQLSTVNERISMGNKLYVAAWTFEIVAAIIGLFVAYYQGLDAFKSFDDAKGGISDERFADVILGGLPFIMVALAEVLKVPIVYLVYINRNIITKAFFSFILLGLTFITFETVSSGFERQFTNITSKVQGPLEELRLTQIEILDLKAKVDVASTITSKTLSNDLSQVKLNLEKSYESDIEGFEKQKEDLLASKNVDLVNDIKEARLELIELKTSKKEVLAEAKVRYETIAKEKAQNIGDKRKSQQDQLNGIIAEINQKEVKIAKSISSGFFTFCNPQCEEWKKDVKDLNLMKLSIQKALSGLSQENVSSYSNSTDGIQNKYNRKIEGVKSQIKALRKKLHKHEASNTGVERIGQKIIARGIRYEKEKSEADVNSNNTEDQLNKDKSQITSWKEKIKELEINKEELNKGVSEHASVSQMHRFTRYWMNFSADAVCEEYYENERVISDKDTESSFNWFGLLQNDTSVNTSQKTEKVCKKYVTKEVTIADVTLENVTKTAFWWYGSLAALVSVMGVVLAFGALILRHPKEKYKDLNPEKHHRLKNTIRRMFISLRKRIREPKIVTKTVIKEVPVEVIKEVPVDKVVLTEVPVEIIKKEIFYEPLYTKDPDLLKFGTAKVRDILSKFGKGKDKKTDKDNKDS